VADPYSAPEFAFDSILRSRRMDAEQGGENRDCKQCEIEAATWFVSHDAGVTQARR